MKVPATLLGVFILLIPVALKAQSPGFREELRFVQYLLDKDLYKEAFTVLAEMDTTLASPAQKDSFYYTLGWAAYQAKQLDTAASALMKVTPLSEVFHKSRSFAAYSLSYQKKYWHADSVFNTIPARDSFETELLRFEQAGIALLQRRYDRYDSLRTSFTYGSYVLQQEEKKLDMYREKMASFKEKSPLLAGVYSAVLPGAGKWYAGKKKQGIAAFLPIASLGAIAYEAYRKGGVKSARFIAFGSLFSLFYVGNIWGSVLSVKVRQREFNKEYDNKILFDMHIPLRNFYN